MRISIDDKLMTIASTVLDIRKMRNNGFSREDILRSFPAKDKESFEFIVSLAYDERLGGINSVSKMAKCILRMILSMGEIK